ncbi:MAG: hypothetical protein ACUVV6_02410 [Thermoplasmatota archaeon]
MRGGRIEPNHLLNIIGITLVLAALGGFALYTEVPAGGAGLRTYIASFPVDGAPGPGGSGETADGSTSESLLTIELANLTRVALNLEFSDRYRLSFVSPAGAMLRVTSPEGEVREASCQPGGPTQASVEFELNDPPSNATLAASSLSDAQRRVAALCPPALNGTGVWTIEVTATREYLLPIHGQGSIYWSVETRLESYAAQVEERHAA